jgi:hypothetical protein
MIYKHIARNLGDIGCQIIVERVIIFDSHYVVFRHFELNKSLDRIVFKAVPQSKSGEVRQIAQS